MNQKIANPFIVNMMAPTDRGNIAQNGRRIYVPINARWVSFTSELAPIQSDAYDSVIVHLNGDIPFDKPDTVHNIQIKLNQISKMANSVDKAVLNDADKDMWYFLNAPYSMEGSHGYAPSDKTVLAKYESFETEQAWQKHQSEVWSRMADMMPLQTGSYGKNANHLEALTNPKRGLEQTDLDEFWSFRSGQLLTPAIMGDDMIGMPGVLGQDYDGFTIVQTRENGVAVEKPLPVRSLRTMGMSGIAIPMANAVGDVPKYQIATDISRINVGLKARAVDGVSIQKSEYFDKNKNMFLFKFTDGTKTKLQVADATPTGDITLSDVNGTFPVHMGQDVKPLLLERGYDIPPLMEQLRVAPNAKYIWQSRGTMIGSAEVSKVVSPSNAGFVLGREPKNGKDDYVVLVTEGALKGRIVAKYADVNDKTGRSFGDEIAGDSGIIVAQVPGVAKAFVESVAPIYSKYKISNTLIAMDADGRENLTVARGIKTAYTCLADHSKAAGTDAISVMSWNPDQKGLDDALLAVAQKKITISDMGVQYGTPEQLFPLKQATAPNPYRLDGTRANRQAWQIEDDVNRKETNAKIKAAQAETAQRTQKKDPVLVAIQDETLRRAAQAIVQSGTVQPEGDALQTRAETIQNGGDDLQKELSDIEESQTKETSMQP